MSDTQLTLPAWMRGVFFRNIAILVSGTAIAQVISLLFLPWITRLYGPEAFGALGYYSSLLSFLTPLAALCYPLALVLPKRAVEARLIFELSLKIAIYISLLMIFVFFFIEQVYKELIPFSGTYVLVPFGMFLSFNVMAYTQWAIRVGRYRLIALITILAAISGGVAKIALGYYYSSATTLIAVTIIVLLFNFVLLSKNLSIRITQRELLKFRVRHFAIAKKYIRFPAFRTPHSLMAIVSQIAPIFLLASFYGPKYAGYFVLARTIMSAPVTLIGKAVYDVSYPRIADRYNSDLKNFKFILKLTSGLAVLSIVPLAVVSFWGGSIFTFAFGDEWGKSGIYAGWMALWYAFNFSNKAIAAAVSVYSMDNFLFRNGFINMIMSLIGFFTGTLYFSSDTISIALFSLFGVFCQCLLFYKVLNIVKRHDINKVTSSVGL